MQGLIRRIHPIIATVFFVVMLAFVFTLPYERVADPYRAGWDLLCFAAMLIFCIAGPRLPRIAMDLSYSLYLTHCIVRAFFIGTIPLGFDMFWRLLLISLPICVASWYLIESPALSLKKKFRRDLLVNTPENKHADLPLASMTDKAPQKGLEVRR